MTPALPDRFEDATHLDDTMSAPDPAVAADLAAVPGDIAVIGVGGKMGPTLARMARRALPGRRVIGVARFSDPGLRAALEAVGIETIQADLLDRAQVAALPRVPNVVFMAGRKFGSMGSEELTWAMNAHVPALVAEHFRDSRIVAFSTICVYPFASVAYGGPREDAALSPPGEYAMSCVARERIFQHFSKVHGTPGALIRLSYAIDMRYGVLHDLGRKVLAGQPVDVTMGHVNVIWQGDACAQALRALARAAVPSVPINVSGPEIVSIRWLAQEFGRRFGTVPTIVGDEAPTAWIANCARAAHLFGYPKVPLERLIDWQADWLMRGMGSLGKATHFEMRSGTF
jgi:nucleoside-diphosphate-sugar epimerase